MSTQVPSGPQPSFYEQQTVVDEQPGTSVSKDVLNGQQEVLSASDENNNSKDLARDVGSDSESDSFLKPCD